MSSSQESLFGKNKTLIFILVSFLAGAGGMYFFTKGKHEAAVDKWEPQMPAASVMGSVAGSMAGVKPSAPATADSSNAPGLGDLLPRLEAKVAANPGDTDGRILLAQTYGELGQRAKGLEAMRTLHQESPLNDRVTFALGAHLMKSEDKPDLQEALRLLEVSAASKQAAINNLAHVYQGQVMVKLGDTQGAIKMLSSYLKTLPAGDERRAAIEAELAKESKK